MKFNLFDIEITQSFWFDYTILSAPSTTGANRKSIRSRIKQLWLDNIVLAEATTQNSSWVLLRKGCEANEYNDLKSFGYRFTPTAKVPSQALLNFYFTALSSSAGAVTVFREPSRKYWESSRRKSGAIITCLYPTFDLMDGMITIDVSATCFRQPRKDEIRGMPKYLFSKAEEGVFDSDSYATPVESCYLHEPVIRKSRSNVPWMIDEHGLGTTACKVDFLNWVVSAIEKSGLAKIRQIDLPIIPIKDFIGKTGAKANLSKKTLEVNIKSAIGERSIKLYDRRTDIGKSVPWDVIFSAFAEEANSYGLKCLDMNQLPFDLSKDVCLVCIDDPDLFDRLEDDTKPIAIDGFPASAQCFTTNLLKISGTNVDGEHDASPILRKNTALMTLANEVIKTEVVGRMLIMDRPWKQESLSRFAFCMRAVVSEKSAYHSVNIQSDGSIEFKMASSSEKIAAELFRQGLIPVFRVDPEDGLDEFYKPINGTVEIRSTKAKALPLPNRAGMTEHFSGINVIPMMNAYYSGPSERPAKLAVERALVIRQINLLANDVDLSSIAAFCVDPTIRLSQATVWPAPYKLLREYLRLKIA